MQAGYDISPPDDNNNGCPEYWIGDDICDWGCSGEVSFTTAGVFDGGDCGMLF